MVGVETIAKVRRDHFVHGKRIKEISRERGISRNSVRKILRSGDTEFAYDRPLQPLPKLGAFVERLEAMLEANERRPKRERLRLTRIFDGEGRARHRFEGRPEPPRRLRRRLRQRAALCRALAGEADDRRGERLRAAELCAGRSLTCSTGATNTC